MATAQPLPVAAPRSRWGDRVFRGMSRTAVAVVVLLMAGIGVFLLIEALPALAHNQASFLSSSAWSPDDTPPKFGIAALVYGSLVTSVLAMLIALPVAIGVALYITHYAPARLAQALGYLVDLLAAVPSVVYGLWGLMFLVPNLMGFSAFLSDTLGWIPVFASDGIYGKSIFAASVVLAIMVLPIIAAISREVFLQTPHENIEAAYALGATRWEMIRYAVLPYGRSGVISGAVLGFGRALGETIAVAMVLSASYTISPRILAPGGNTIAANIANTFGDAGKTGRGALIASGLVLFAITLVVNFSARAIIARRSVDRPAKARS